MTEPAVRYETPWATDEVITELISDAGEALTRCQLPQAVEGARRILTAAHTIEEAHYMGSRIHVGMLDRLRAGLEWHLSRGQVREEVSNG